MRFSDPLFVERRQRVLHAKTDALGRHFSNQQIQEFYKRYGPGTGRIFAEAFVAKREKMSEAFDLFLDALEPNAPLEDIILEAGRAFEYANGGHETFNIDIWVIADFLMGLQLQSLGERSHEQVAELVGSHITQWLDDTSAVPGEEMASQAQE